MNTILRKTHSLTTVALLLLATTVIFSQETLAAATKIASVNLQKVMDESKAGKKAMSTLKSRAERERSKLEKLGKEIQALEKEINQGKLMLRPDALESKQSTLRRKTRELKLLQDDTQESFRKFQAQVMRSIINDSMKVIKDYGKKNGYTLVVEQSQNGALGGPVVLYVDETTDITADIVKALDAKRSGK